MPKKKESTLKALSLYEAHPSSYIIYLQTFLVKTKQKVNEKIILNYNFLTLVS
nr:BBA14 family lipoprotein [Borrelia sp. CA_690]WKC84015.1 hypothetical protein QIA37_00280 [Borrelia sp. CA_690]